MYIYKPYILLSILYRYTLRVKFAKLPKNPNTLALRFHPFPFLYPIVLKLILLVSCGIISSQFTIFISRCLPHHWLASTKFRLLLFSPLNCTTVTSFSVFFCFFFPLPRPFFLLFPISHMATSISFSPSHTCAPILLISHTFTSINSSSVSDLTHSNKYWLLSSFRWQQAYWQQHLLKKHHAKSKMKWDLSNYAHIFNGLGLFPLVLHVAFHVFLLINWDRFSIACGLC